MRIRNHFDKADPFSRRRFLGGAAHGLLGVGAMPFLSQLASAQDPQDPAAVPLRPATARNVIYLYMSGGMSHLDTFDPKPGKVTQGPTESTATNAFDVRINSHFSNLKRHMDKICVFRGLQSTQGAHEQGRYFMHTSYELRGTIKHPTMGAWLDRLSGRANPALPGHVQIGGGQYTASSGFFESTHGPLPIGDPEAGLQNSQRPSHVDESTAERRRERLAQMNAAFAERYDTKQVRAYKDAYDQAVRLMGSRELAAFDITEEDETTRAAYGDDKFGQGCLLARRLVEHGVRFVEVVHGGWDTHDQNFDRMDDLLPPMDQTIAALLSDLESRGLLEETLVVLATEFGRTPDIVSGRNGRNHYPKAFSCWMAGGGINGGRAWGATDEFGREVIENPVTVPDFNATIAFALGLPTEHQIISPTQRPFTIADKGRPVTEVFA